MNGRLAYALRRVLLTIPVLIATSIFVFLLIRLVPGDPVQTMLGIRATPENIATVRLQLGLDRPLPVQYWEWVTGALHGDLGEDCISHESISTLLKVALPVTLPVWTQVPGVRVKLLAVAVPVLAIAMVALEVPPGTRFATPPNLLIVVQVAELTATELVSVLLQVVVVPPLTWVSDMTSVPSVTVFALLVICAVKADSVPVIDSARAAVAPTPAMTAIGAKRRRRRALRVASVGSSGKASWRDMAGGTSRSVITWVGA